MARRDEPTTIGEILELPPSRGRDDKSWVPGPFEAIVRHARERKPRAGGRSFFTCELEDPHNSNNFLEATADIDFTRMEGSLVEVTGQGISREEYNGKPQIKMGKNAEVHVLSGGGRSARSDPPPARTDTPPARSSSRDANSSEDSAPKDRPYGPAVGGAVETAARAIMAMKDPPQPGTVEFSKLLWEVSSDIFRVNHLIQSGFNKLADKASDRANPKAAAERKAAAEEAARKAAAEEEARRKAEEEANRQANREQDPGGDEEDPDDDVPF